MKKFLLIPLMLLMMAVTISSSWAKESVPLDGMINVNTATADQLTLLPGVGPSKAQLIIAARTQKPFSKKEDLLSVKGIGEKILGQITPYVAFEGNTTLGAKKVTQ